jgi:hypothetical protein
VIPERKRNFEPSNFSNHWQTSAQLMERMAFACQAQRAVIEVIEVMTAGQLSGIFAG